MENGVADGQVGTTKVTAPCQEQSHAADLAKEDLSIWLNAFSRSMVRQRLSSEPSADQVDDGFAAASCPDCMGWKRKPKLPARIWP